MYLSICLSIYLYMNTMCAVSSACDFRAVADAFRPLKTSQRY